MSAFLYLYVVRKELKSDLRPDFHLPSEIFIRQDIVNNMADIISQTCTRVIIITTTTDLEIYDSVLQKISNNLKEAGIGNIVYDELPPSPNTEDIDLAVSFAKKTNCNGVVGFGGVESINAAKAISLLINNYIFAHDFFTNPNITKPPLPLFTVPAYPVFGFEIAPILYLNEIHENTKQTYFDLRLYPKATIVDPGLSLYISDELTMKTTLSTLSMATESVISINNNNIINTYALKSIDLIFRNLPVTYREPKNSVPRSYLATASVMSGIAFSISYLSLTLAIALALASKSEISVEGAMTIILPHIMEFNLTASPGKYVQMSKVMGEEVKDITVIEAAIKAVEGIRKLETDIDVPQRLSNYDVQKSIFNDVSQLAVTYPFINNAPRELNASEIETILIAAY